MFLRLCDNDDVYYGKAPLWYGNMTSDNGHKWCLANHGIQIAVILRTLLPLLSLCLVCTNAMSFITNAPGLKSVIEDWVTVYGYSS